MGTHLAATALVLLTACASIRAAEAPLLPVWIEESHAGSFYFLADTLPLNEPHTLLLVDAHSDANAIPNSDAIRAELRQVASREERREKFARWRQAGRIQCFDWIEPLMPAPISEVIWIPAKALDEATRSQMETDARELLDAHEEGLPRDGGALAGRLRVMDLRRWLEEVRQWPQDRRVVASIDLDWFANTPDMEIDRDLAELTRSILALRGLRALTWALSTPWLKSQEQADRLLRAALDESGRMANATVRWEPFATAGPDRSMLAKLKQRRGEQLPSYDLASASPALRSLILSHWTENMTRMERPRLEQFMDEWRADAFLPSISMPDRPREPDGSYSVDAREAAQIVMNPPPTGAYVRWWALRAAHDSYRITETDFGFASDAPRWIQSTKHLLAEGAVMGSLGTAQLKPVLDPQHACGTVRLFAEIVRDGEVRWSNEITVTLRAAGSQGLRAAWSQDFAKPYVFGASGARMGNLSGAETGWGADCANFLIAGLRHEGWLIPWGSPRDLKRSLVPWSGPVEAERGCVLHFGAHVAALWEDRPPLGELNADDLLVHQLEGTPAVVTMAELAKGRPAPEAFAIRQPARTLRLVFGGDVMLGRRVHHDVLAGRNPLVELGDFLRAADLTVVNLEGPLLPEGMARDASAPLAAPAQALACLHEVGVDAVSLSNNHALDRGQQGLRDTLEALQSSPIRFSGVGVSEQEAWQAAVLEAGGRRIGLISVWDDESTMDRPGSDQLATTRNRKALIQAIVDTARKVDLVIVLPHWGNEHSLTPSPRQRELAKDWLHAGARLIIGCGPHVVQPLEHLMNGSVAWSLGNLVFDGPGPTREWSRGALLELTLDADTLRLHRARLLSVDLENGGTVRRAGDLRE